MKYQAKNKAVIFKSSADDVSKIYCNRSFEGSDITSNENSRQPSNKQSKPSGSSSFPLPSNKQSQPSGSSSFTLRSPPVSIKKEEEDDANDFFSQLKNDHLYSSEQKDILKDSSESGSEQSDQEVAKKIKDTLSEIAKNSVKKRSNNKMSNKELKATMSIAKKKRKS